MSEPSKEAMEAAREWMNAKNSDLLKSGQTVTGSLAALLDAHYAAGEARGLERAGTSAEQRAVEVRDARKWGKQIAAHKESTALVIAERIRALKQPAPPEPQRAEASEDAYTKIIRLTAERDTAIRERDEAIKTRGELGERYLAERERAEKAEAAAQGYREIILAVNAALPEGGTFDTIAPRVQALREQLERERMRLAACGVVAMSNTEESAKRAREMHPDYRSASCDDVAAAVDREMALRARCERLEAALRNVLDEASLQAHFKGCDSRLDPARFERANSLVVCPACAAEALLSESKRE